jgi:hypothetical protein
MPRNKITEAPPTNGKMGGFHKAGNLQDKDLKNGGEFRSLVHTGQGFDHRSSDSFEATSQ